MEELTALVRESVVKAGFTELADLAPRLARYIALLLAANRDVNLVSRASAGPEELVRRHVLDSLLGLRFLPSPAGRRLRLLDVGSGAGFPAIPLLLCRADLEGTLVESVGKKCRVLERVIGELDLTARVVNARFPFPHMDGHRFDLLTSRAVADAGALVRDARAFLAPGALALLWTTEPLLADLRSRSGIQSLRFHRAPDAQVRGIAVLECST